MSRLRRPPHPVTARKLPFSLGFRRGAGLALTTAVVVCAQSACLIPQQVEQETPVPSPPPLIVVESIPAYLLSPVLRLQKQGTADAAQVPPCHCTLEFTGISVQEDNPAVALRAKWFVDYDSNNIASTRPWAEEPLPGTFNDVTAIQRTLKVPFNLDADAMNITTSGTHVVEVVIGDEVGFDPASAQPQRGMKPGWFSATYKWAVDVHLEQVTGQCAAKGLPSKQVCQ
jgi:hypothetical protein